MLQQWIGTVVLRASHTQSVIGFANAVQAGRRWLGTLPSTGGAETLGARLRSFKRQSTLWQRLAQLAWLGVALLGVFVLVVGIPLLYQTSVATQPLAHFDRDALWLTPAMALTWQRWGLPISAYGYGIVFTRLAFVFSFVAVSAIIIWRKPNHVVAVIVSFFLLTFAVFSALPQSLLVGRAPLAYAISECLQAIATLLILPVLYLFPNGRFVTRWSAVLIGPWCLLHLAWLLFPQLPFNVIYGETWERTFVWSLLFAEFWYGSGFVAMIYRYRKLATPTEKQQMRWVVVTWCLSFFVGFIYITLPIFINQTGGNLDGGLRLAWNLGFYALVGFVFVLGAVAFAVAILRYRLWDIDRLFSRAARYLLASFIVIVACVLVALLMGGLVNAYAGRDNWYILSAYAVLATLLFTPVQRRVQRVIDRKFDRNKIDTAHAITSFAHEARAVVDLPDLLRLLMTHAVRLFQARSGAIILFDEDGSPTLAQLYNWHANQGGIGVVELLKLIRTHAHTASVQMPPPHLPLLIPLTALKTGCPTRIGYLALGARLSEQTYSRRDADLLRNLAEHAASAIAVAQLVKVQRQSEHHRQSPAGQAEILIAEWKGQPAHASAAFALSHLHTLSQQAYNDPQAQAKLEALPSAAMNASAPTLRLLAEGYAHVLESRTDETMLSIGLRQIVAALSQLPQLPQLPQSQASQASATESDLSAALAFHRLLLQWLSVRSVQHITHAWAGWHELNRAAMPPHHLSLLTLLSALIPVAEVLAKSERSATPQDKLCYLDEAHERLRMQSRLAARVGVSIAKNTTDTLPNATPLDELIFGQVQRAWLSSIQRGIHVLRGQAELRLVLQTRHVIHAPRIGLAVQVTNHGLGPAEAIQLELLPGAGYDCIECWETMPTLASGCTVQANFVVAAEQPALLESALLTVRLRLSFADSYATQHPQHIAEQPASRASHQQEISLQLQVLHPPRYQQLIANPYCAGPPLSANSAVFVGRQHDLSCVVRAVSQGHAHFMLIGPRRMGKTSMLKHLGVQLGGQFVAVFWDGQRLGLESGTAGFFYDAACETAAALEMPMPAFERFESQPAHYFETVFLPQVLNALQGRRLLVQFDEVEELETRVLAGRIGEAIFAWLRHIMQHQPRLSFVFAGAHQPSHLNARLWSPAMNNVLSHRVGHLSSESTRTLITQPTAGHLFYDDLALDHLQRLVAGHPFFTQLFCHTVVDQANQHQRSVVLAEHIRLALPLVLEMGAGQLSEIWLTCTSDEQAVLQALASIHDDDDTTADALCAQHPEAVQSLIERELIASNLGLRGEASYVWRLGLLRAYMGTKRYPTPRSF